MSFAACLLRHNDLYHIFSPLFESQRLQCGLQQILFGTGKGGSYPREQNVDSEGKHAGRASNTCGIIGH